VRRKDRAHGAHRLRHRRGIGRFLRGRELISPVSARDMSPRATTSSVPGDPGLPHRASAMASLHQYLQGISKPKDLIGRKVGTKAICHRRSWMRGHLEHDDGVPHNSMQWLSELDEDVDFTPPPASISPRTGR